MINLKRLITLCLAAATLAACAPATTPPEASVSPSEEPTATLVVPTPFPVPTEFVDYCLDCHSNQEQLVALAKPEPVAESESKGVG